MAIPAPTNTVVGGPLSIDATKDSRAVVCTDTADPYTPEADSRVWQVNGVDVNAISVESTLELVAAGTFPVAVEVTNADGTAAGTEVDVVVTDGYTAPSYYAQPTGRDEMTERILPSALPAICQDGMAATAGIPTGQKIANAELYGSQLASADRVNVIAGGVGQKIALV